MKRITMVLKYHSDRHDKVVNTLMGFGYKKLESYHLAQEIIARLERYASAMEAGQRQYQELIAVKTKSKPYWKG